MDKYTCNFCNKTFVKKSHFIQHTQKRKKPCIVIDANHSNTSSSIKQNENNEYDDKNIIQQHNDSSKKINKVFLNNIDKLNSTNDSFDKTNFECFDTDEFNFECVIRDIYLIRDAINTVKFDYNSKYDNLLFLHNKLFHKLDKFINFVVCENASILKQIKQMNDDITIFKHKI